MTASLISPSSVMLINKSIKTGTFPFQLKQAKVHPILKVGLNQTHLTIGGSQFYPLYQKYLKKHINKHVVGYLNKHKLLHES